MESRWLCFCSFFHNNRFTIASGQSLGEFPASMIHNAANPNHLRGLTVFLALFLAFPVAAYDDIPTSASAIRDAYFLGSRQGSLTPEFLAPLALVS
jgi:hypothetical protein